MYLYSTPVHSQGHEFIFCVVYKCIHVHKVMCLALTFTHIHVLSGIQNHTCQVSLKSIINVHLHPRFCEAFTFVCYSEKYGEQNRKDSVKLIELILWLL